MFTRKLPQAAYQKTVDAMRALAATCPRPEAFDRGAENRPRPPEAFDVNEYSAVLEIQNTTLLRYNAMVTF